MLYSYMEEWRWRMDVLGALGVEQADRFERDMLTPPKRTPAAYQPAARTAFEARRASILAAGGEIG